MPLRATFGETHTASTQLEDAKPAVLDVVHPACNSVTVGGMMCWAGIFVVLHQPIPYPSTRYVARLTVVLATAACMAITAPRLLGEPAVSSFIEASRLLVLVAQLSFTLCVPVRGGSEGGVVGDADLFMASRTAHAAAASMVPHSISMMVVRAIEAYVVR